MDVVFTRCSLVAQTPNFLGKIKYKPLLSNEISAMREVFLYLSCSLRQSHVADEHLKCEYCDWETEFLILLILIYLHLNSHMWPVATKLNTADRNRMISILC